MLFSVFALLIALSATQEKMGIEASANNRTSDLEGTALVLWIGLPCVALVLAGFATLKTDSAPAGRVRLTLIASAAAMVAWTAMWLMRDSSALL